MNSRALLAANGDRYGARSEFHSVLAALTVATLLAGAWYLAWVQPHDEALARVEDCVEASGDYSRDGFDRCFVAAAKGAP